MLKHFLVERIFILDGVRTIIGNPFKSLKIYSSAQLAAFVIKALIERNDLSRNVINEVILGNAISSGEGQNVARQAAIFADLPEEVIAYSVNNVCGAGMQSIFLGIQSILAKKTEVVIAGGVESATHTPYFVKRIHKEGDHLKKDDLIDSLLFDGLFCQITGKSMGQLVENIAVKYRISREEQDQFALKSHYKASLAQEQGKLLSEIIPIKALRNNIVQRDDRPRPNLKLENLRDLPTAFKKGGTVTAGNSSAPCDGAAGVLLASQKFVKANKIKPRASIVAYTSIGVHPETTFESLAPVITECLKQADLIMDKIDLFEVSEPFAAPLVLLQKKLNIPDHKLNVMGGDLALGHPLGAAGTRVVVTLFHALEEMKLKRGLACICYGGGGASAIIIERK